MAKKKSFGQIPVEVACLYVKIVEMVFETKPAGWNLLRKKQTCERQANRARPCVQQPHARRQRRKHGRHELRNRGGSEEVPKFLLPCPSLLWCKDAHESKFRIALRLLAIGRFRMRDCFHFAALAAMASATVLRPIGWY
jgi:hypothetical protein